MSKYTTLSVKVETKEKLDYAQNVLNFSSKQATLDYFLDKFIAKKERKADKILQEMYDIKPSKVEKGIINLDDIDDLIAQSLVDEIPD